MMVSQWDLIQDLQMLKQSKLRLWEQWNLEDQNKPQDKNINGTIYVPKDLFEFFLDALYLSRQTTFSLSDVYSVLNMIKKLVVC